MNYLFLDSSNYFLSIGLKKNDYFDKISYPCSSKSVYMISEINKILNRNKITIKKINGIIISIGPGSFVGIRTSLTFAKIISFILKIPIYTLSTLEINKKINHNSIVLFDARNERSYIASFNKKKRLLKDQIMSNIKVKKYISKHKNFSLIGNINYLNLKIKNEKIDTLENMNYLFKKKKAIYDPNLLKPIYLKKYLKTEK